MISPDRHRPGTPTAAGEDRAGLGGYTRESACRAAPGDHRYEPVFSRWPSNQPILARRNAGGAWGLGRWDLGRARCVGKCESLTEIARLAPSIAGDCYSARSLQFGPWGGSPTLRKVGEVQG